MRWFLILLELKLKLCFITKYNHFIWYIFVMSKFYIDIIRLYYWIFLIIFLNIYCSDRGLNSVWFIPLFSLLANVLQALIQQNLSWHLVYTKTGLPTLAKNKMNLRIKECKVREITEQKLSFYLLFLLDNNWCQK